MCTLGKLPTEKEELHVSFMVFSTWRMQVSIWLRQRHTSSEDSVCFWEHKKLWTKVAYSNSMAHRSCKRKQQVRILFDG